MITYALITNGFEFNGRTRYDIWAVIRGELPADKYNPSELRFEIVSEDIAYLPEWGCELIGVEEDGYDAYSEMYDEKYDEKSDE